MTGFAIRCLQPTVDYKHLDMVKDKPPKPTVIRFGVAELYTRDFANLPPEELRHLVSHHHAEHFCSFRGAPCNKKGGVCTLRPYQKAEVVAPVADPLVTVCPQRFFEGGEVYRWIGETLLNSPQFSTATEVDFLQGETQDTGEAGEPVGRIDTILLRPDTEPLIWCAVEFQAVYFSGKGMRTQFDEFAKWQGPGIPFPNEIRRPDYRSSGPKRLMPQLQVKIPTLRRWGKKMAVVTDLSFFQHMGRMDEAHDISNCDIVWFVVDYDFTGEGFRLVKRGLHLITLERAIEGLIAGEAVSLNEFETRMMARLVKGQAKRDRVR